MAKQLTLLQWLFDNGVIGVYQFEGQVLGHYIFTENGPMDIDLEELRKLNG